jgi:hypothetical protein
MSKHHLNKDVPYDTIIRVLLKKIKSQEKEIENLKKDNIENNVCKVIKHFKKSLDLTNQQILQMKLNPYYLAQVRENINLKNQINKLRNGMDKD